MAKTRADMVAHDGGVQDLPAFPTFARPHFTPLPTLPPAERIIAVARELFCRDGIHATGIDRILSEARASKMTLYTRFGSKEALLREVLLREGAEWRAAFFAATQQGETDALLQLHQVIRALEIWFDSGRFYGCSFMNAAAEHAKGEPVLRELAAGHHRQVLDFLEGLAVAAGLVDPGLTARQILLTIDGTIAALMVTGDPTVLAVARRNIGSILAQAAGDLRGAASEPADQAGSARSRVI